MHDQSCQRTSQLVLWYRDFLEHGKSAAFVSCVATRYSNATLGRLCRSPESEIRRASVLALGMLGAGESIAVVGRCLRDKDRCVRLVAEIAFADLTRRQLGSAPAMWLDQVRRHVDGHRYEKSSTMLDELLASYPDFSEAWYLRGVVCFCVGNYRQAQDACWQALATNRHHFAAHRLIARCWLEQEDSIKAVSAFERSFALNPSQHDVKGYIDVLKKRTRDVNIDDPQ